MTDGVFNEAPPAQENVDNEALMAKRLADKDAYIAQLEGETAEMRNALTKAEAEKEAQRIIEEARKAAAPAPSREATPASSEPAKPLNEDELVERVLKAQTERQAQATEQANAKAASDRLVELYGTEEAANKVVLARAAELGVSPAFLLSTAKQSPSAFFDLMKLDTAPKQVLAPRSDANPAALATHAPGVKEGTNAYYEQLRKQIGDAAYYTPKYQQQRFADAKRLGDAFFQ